MWTVASWAGGSETKTEGLTFGAAVDLRDKMRAAGDFTAVVLEHFTLGGKCQHPDCKRKRGE